MLPSLSSAILDFSPCLLFQSQRRAYGHRMRVGAPFKMQEALTIARHPELSLHCPRSRLQQLPGTPRLTVAILDQTSAFSTAVEVGRILLCGELPYRHTQSRRSQPRPPSTVTSLLQFLSGNDGAKNIPSGPSVSSVARLRIEYGSS